MRKSVIIILLVAVALCAWLLLKYKPQSSSDLAGMQSETNQLAVKSALANPPTNAAPVDASTNAIVSSVVITPPPPPVTNNVPILNLLDAHNIDEWKAAIPKLSHDTETTWSRVQFPTVPPMPFVIGSIPFNSDSVDIHMRRDNSGNVRRIEIQSLTMNVADLRALGDSLLQMMGKDNTDFHAWCDKAGNNYLYSPLFDSGDARLQNGKVYGFDILCGFNGVKPWIINFVITDP